MLNDLLPLLLIPLVIYIYRHLSVPIKVYYSPTLQSKLLSTLSTSSKSYRFISLLNSFNNYFSNLHKFQPTIYLFNGYLQTIYTSLINSKVEPVIQYDREIVTLTDSGKLALDWCPSKPTSSTDTKDKVLILLLHGLTGSSNEEYIRRLVPKIINLPSSKLDVVVFNFRGCGKVPLETQILYNAFDTKDLRFCLKYLKSLGYLKILAVGYSLGSNLLVTYLGEEGGNSEIDGAVSVGNPYDLQECSNTMMSSWIEAKVIDKVLGDGLKDLLRSHKNVFSEGYFNFEQIYGVRDFDREVTSKMGNFYSVDEYYRKGSSDQYLFNVKVPLLLFSCEDDIISPKAAIPYQDVKINNNLILVTCKKGGHLGSWYNAVNPKSFIDDLVLDFIRGSLLVIYDEVPKNFVIET